MVSEGALVADKYRVECLLGEGGMGHVYAAIHEQLGIRVAIKILSPTLCQSEDAVRRFSREARASVRIQSEHVARVIDVGQLENGAPYMVMEFLSGNDLSHELKGRGSLPTHEAIQYVLQASEAVAEAHALGVIHRDLKPANLFLTRRSDGSPLVKVLDFGIAKAVAPDQGAFEPSPSLTATHSFLGSPAYMSPEQVRTPKLVDSRSDIWSLGTILYELLMGELPFRGSNALDLLAAVASDPMPSIRAKRPDVSPELEAVIAKCLEKKPVDRYESIAAFAQALGPHAPPSSLPSVARISGIQRPATITSLVPGVLADGATLRSTPAGRTGDDLAPSTHPSMTPPAGDKHTVTDFGRSQAAKPSSRSRVLLAAALGAAAVVAVFWLVFSHKGAALESSAAKGSPQTPTSHEPSAQLVTVAPPTPPAVTPIASTSAPTASASAVVVPTAMAPKATHKASSPVRPAAIAPPVPATQPSPPPGGDPLDGRR
ncbi:MAG TPA: serine/threonine-protein kinase [Polyangiaceae bacterium]|nr:serine/threonine-protein kinase [Polyangiaceae bacterium]